MRATPSTRPHGLARIVGSASNRGPADLRVVTRDAQPPRRSTGRPGRAAIQSKPSRGVGLRRRDPPDGLNRALLNMSREQAVPAPRHRIGDRDLCRCERLPVWPHDGTRDDRALRLVRLRHRDIVFHLTFVAAKGPRLERFVAFRPEPEAELGVRSTLTLAWRRPRRANVCSRSPHWNSPALVPGIRPRPSPGRSACPSPRREPGPRPRRSRLSVKTISSPATPCAGRRRNTRCDWRRSGPVRRGIVPSKPAFGVGFQEHPQRAERPPGIDHHEGLGDRPADRIDDAALLSDGPVRA